MSHKTQCRKFSFQVSEILYQNFPFCFRMSTFNFIWFFKLHYLTLHDDLVNSNVYNEYLLLKCHNMTCLREVMLNYFSCSCYLVLVEEPYPFPRLKFLICFITLQFHTSVFFLFFIHFIQVFILYCMKFPMCFASYVHFIGWGKLWKKSEV